MSSLTYGNGGLDSGSLYYLDGEDEHQKEGVPNSYRSCYPGVQLRRKFLPFPCWHDQAGTANHLLGAGSARKKSPGQPLYQHHRWGRPAAGPARVDAFATYPVYLGHVIIWSACRPVLPSTPRLGRRQSPVPSPGAANLQVSYSSHGRRGNGRALAKKAAVLAMVCCK